MYAYRTAQSSNTESLKRITTVSKQYELEMRLVEKAKKTPNHGIKSLFFVPAALTPLFINPETITVDNDGFHVFIDGHREPEGLVPEKNRAREILTTVVSRRISLELMLQNGIEVTVMRHSENRPKADGLPGFVDNTELKKIILKYPTLLKFIDISKEIYEQNKDLPAAVYFDDGSFHAVYSLQMNSPEQPNRPWGIDNENTDFVNPMKAICEQYRIEFPIDAYDPILDMRRLFGNI